MIERKSAELTKTIADWRSKESVMKRETEGFMELQWK